MKASELAAAIAVGLVAGAILFRGSGEDKGRARADSLATVVDTLKATDLRRARDSAAAADSARRLTERLDALATSRRAHQRMGDSILAAVQRSYDTLVPQRVVVALAAEKDSAITGLLHEQDSWRALVQLTAAERDSARSAATAWRRVALEAQQQTEAALRRAERRWGCVGGAGASAGYGFGAGLSVTCGRRL